MKLLTDFFNTISPLKEKTWDELLPLFHEDKLISNRYFARENEVSRKIAFHESGVVRTFLFYEDGQLQATTRTKIIRLYAFKLIKCRITEVIRELRKSSTNYNFFRKRI